MDARWQVPHAAVQDEELLEAILARIILGLISAFLASKIVNKTGEGIMLDIVLVSSLQRLKASGTNDWTRFCWCRMLCAEDGEARLEEKPSAQFVESLKWNALAEARMGNTRRTHRLAAPVSSKDHVRGSPLARVTLVGYGDFTCPDCAKSYRAVKKIQAEMGSLLRYIFRSFPRSTPDQKSGDAAEAAESAGAQGKFWEIHDRMFENQGASNKLELTQHARAVGLNEDQFRKDMWGHVHLARVRVVREGGVQSGVVDVPTFFINSLQHESAFGLATLLPAVQAAAGGS